MSHDGEILNYINKKDPEGINPETGAPYRIMVVDDSAAMRMIVSKILKSEAYEICGEAENGAEAVENYKELRPDLVTMDVHMPIMEGLEAVKEIIKVDSSARIVMITSDSEDRIVKEAITNGAKNFAVKPPERRLLLDKIKASL